MTALPNAAVVEIVERVPVVGGGYGVIKPNRVRVNGTDVGLLKIPPVVDFTDEDDEDRPGPLTVTLVLYASSVTIGPEAAEVAQ